MALIVKSSIDILPWTELEKQKLIEEKKEFLNKKEEKEEFKIEKIEKIEEVEEIAIEENVEETKIIKNSNKKTSFGKRNKKEVTE